MRLLKLELTDFLNHESTVIEFDRITLIAGENNTGKTAIIDALEMALTGTARYTDKAGKLAAPVVRAGRASFWVSAEVEVEIDGKLVTLAISRSKGTTGGHSLDITPVGGEPWQGGPKRMQEALHRTLNADAGTIRACLHAWKLPVLKPEEQEALILDYLGLKVDLGEIEKLLQGAGATADDCKLLYHGPKNAFLARYPIDAGTRFPPEIFDEADMWAREKRRQAKRDLGSASAALDVAHTRIQELLDESPKLVEADDGSADRMRDQMVDLEGRRDELNQARGKSAVKGTEGLVPEEIENDIAKLEKRLASRLEWEKRRDDFTGKGDLEGQIAICERSLETLEEQIKPVEADILELERKIQGLDETDPVCPIIEETCDRLEGHRAKTLKSYRGRLTRRRKKREELGEGGDLPETLSALREIRDAEPEGPDGDRLVSEITLKRTQLAELADVPDTSEIDGELEPLKARISRGHAKIRTVQTYRGAIARKDEEETRARELTDQVEAWERLVKALSPSGAKLKAVDVPLEELERTLNERMQELAPHHELSLRSEGGFEILTRTPGTGSEWISLKGISMSEALRIGTAIAAILSDLSGLKLLVVDNFEWLVGTAKNDLAAALHKWCTVSGILESVVILQSTETRPKPNTARRAYWIEDGKAEVIG